MAKTRSSNDAGCVVRLSTAAERRDALLRRCVPYLVLLGDFIGNGPKNDPEGRCTLIGDIQDEIGDVRLYRAGYEATEGPTHA